MDMLERFIKYCQYNTRSDATSLTVPSSHNQYRFAADVLVNDLKAIGVEDVVLSESGVVYGKIHGNDGSIKNKVGFIAHMDTADYNSENIKPQIIENYDGNDIKLNESMVLSPSQFPSLKDHVGKTIVCTDGTTLLGGDDKAGIVIIMEMAKTLINDLTIRHGEIRIAFTPDEEIGHGTDHFDLKQFDADYGFTIDGGDIHSVTLETFNAAKAAIDIQGFSIHPGGAKGKMVNAIDIAVQLATMLPGEAKPQYTQGHEGFYHLESLNGNCEHATMHYIIRDHDHTKLKDKKNYFKHLVETMNIRYDGAITLKMEDQYRNMSVVLKDHPEVLETVENTFKAMGWSYTHGSARGGTDGANLSFMGLPCPNLGTGGYNGHGPYEYVVVEQMRAMVDFLVTMVSKETL